MKKSVTIASLVAVSALTSGASAALNFYNSFASWQTAASGVPAGIITAGGAVYGSDWSGGYAPTDTTPTPTGLISFGGGWQRMTAQSTGPALTVSGSNISVSNNSSAVQNITFTFTANTWGAPNGPVDPNGFYAFGINFTGFNGTDIYVVVNNNLVTAQNVTGLGTSGFVGVVLDYTGATGIRLKTVTFIVSQNQGMDITGAAFGAVPAPGAAALIGLAGLVGSRRRR